VVSPLLISTVPTKQYTRRKRELSQEGVNSSGAALTFADMRLHKVPDTIIAGAFTGGVLSAWRFGKRKALPGAVTAGLVCGVLHWMKNEFGVRRIQYVARVQEHRPLQQPDIASESTISWPERFLSLLGFERLSDDDYLQKMVKRRDASLVRIKELEREIEEQQSKS